MFNFLLSACGDTSQLPTTLIMIVVLLLVFWLFMIRPQKQQQKRDEEMRDNLAVGDEVTTIGGIIGKIVSIKGETFVLETTKDKTKIRFLKAAIRSVDVKAAEIAAAVMEAQTEENAENANAAEDAPAAEEVKEIKSAKKKSKKAKAAEAAGEDTPVVEASAEQTPAEDANA